MRDPLRIPPKTTLLLIAFASFIAIGLQGGALSVAWLHMQATFGRTLESLGILLAAITIGSLVISFNSGRIIAAVGVGRLCFLASVVGLLGLLVTSFTPSWGGLVVAALLLGVGRSGLNTGVNTFVAHHYPASRMNWLHAVFGVGSTLGPLLITFLVIDLARPWQWGYLALAVVQLGITVLFAVTLGRWRLAPGRAEEPGGAARGPRLRDSLRLVPVWLGIALFISHTGMQLSAGQLTNNLFVEGRGIDPKVAGLWISLFWAAITAGRLLFGAVIDRVGVAPVLRLCTAGTVAGAILLWWNPGAGLSFAGLVVMGLTLAPVYPSSVSRTPGLVGVENSPNAIGLQLAGAALGSALLPGLVGVVADRVGLEVIPVCLVIISLGQFLLHELVTRREGRQLRLAAES